MKNWYDWRKDILNFVMMCLVFSCSYLFKKYRCVSENDTLFSQPTNTLPHIIFQKFFICVKFQLLRLFYKKFFEKKIQFLLAFLNAQQQYVSET